MYYLITLFTLLFAQEQTPNFEADCDELSSWIGGIQGVEQSRKTTPYLMAECHSNLNYDLIWVLPKNSDITAFRLTQHLNNGTDKEIEKLRSFAFVIPKVDPIEPENEFDVYDYVFPSYVEVYTRNNGTWKLINTEQIESFEQLGELKLKTVTKK
ncbi:MAG: hypothetical protein RIA69_01410 [Cyclobacteriaceae bacterium]